MEIKLIPCHSGYCTRLQTGGVFKANSGETEHLVNVKLQIEKKKF